MGRLTVLGVIGLMVVGGCAQPIQQATPQGTTDVAFDYKREVKSNAHTLQTMIETFGVDHRGEYPRDLPALKREAEAQGYWRSLNNPVDARLPAFDDQAVPGGLTYAYDPVRRSYKIHCWDALCKPLLDTRQQPFTLTNS